MTARDGDGVSLLPGAPRPKRPKSQVLVRADARRNRSLAKLVRESPLIIDRDNSKQLQVHSCMKLLKDELWQLSKEADSKLDRTAAILVEQSIGYYQSTAAGIVRARRVVQRHNANPEDRLWFSRFRFDAPRLSGVESARFAFRAPSDTVERVSGLACDLGWEHRGPLICLCIVRTISEYGYGHDLKAYRTFLDEFERLLTLREEQALRLVRETHLRLLSRSAYKRGALDEFISEHPELEAADA